MRVLHDTLEQAARICPEKQAVLFEDKAMTYAQFHDEATRLAAVLLEAGIRKADRVAFFLEKRFEKISCIYGISQAGAVFVPVRRLSHGNQAAHIINDCGAKVLITTYSRFPVIAEFLHEMPSLETVIAIGPPQDAGTATLPGRKVLDWSRALAEAKIGVPVRVVESDLAAIMYTSGSTGKPKGVVLSQLNIMAGARSISEYLKITENDRILSILTFGFDYGLNQLTSAFLHRAQLVLLEYLFPKDIVNYSRKFGVTGIATVATTWIQLMQFPWTEKDIPTLRYITNSGGAIPENYVRELRTRLPHVSIYLMYGLTEAFRSTFLDPSLVDKYPTSIGKAVPGEEILVLDENQKPVKPGEIGELVHRGVFVAQGYWNSPELTAIRYKRNPFQPPEIPLPEMTVFSGDRVRIDADGFLFFVGRNDEMIKSSGIRISPTEVEEVLYASGLVESAMVMGVPNEVLGSTIYAVVAGAPGKSLTADVLLAYCKKHMPPYMVPKTVEVRDSLPRNANGKLDRAAIKKEVQAALGISKG